jgi:DcmR-like sensory protein
MTAISAALLAHPHPCRHIVYPYTDENLVGQAVALFAGHGLRDGDGIILITMESHCRAIDRYLEAEGFDPTVLQKAGRLVRMLSEDLLSRVMTSGRLDHRRFKAIMGGIIAHARALNGTNPQSKVRVFCEMVSLPWSANRAAAIDMEELWDEVIETHGVYLLCTYDLRNSGHARATVPDRTPSGRGQHCCTSAAPCSMFP